MQDIWTVTKNASVVIGKFLSVEVSAAQVYRVTDCYGKVIGKSEGVLDRTMPPVKQEEILYVEADGSMLLTREEGWKEVKLGKIFKSGDCIDPNGKLSWIRHSQYLAYLGDSKTFTQQMDDLLASYGSLDNIFSAVVTLAVYSMGIAGCLSCSTRCRSTNNNQKPPLTSCYWGLFYWGLSAIVLNVVRRFFIVAGKEFALFFADKNCQCRYWTMVTPYSGSW